MARTDEERFAEVSITGGPVSPVILLDGVMPKGVTGFELKGSAREVLRLKTFQIVRAAITVQAEHEHAVTVNVFAEREEGRDGKIVIVGEEQIATATADTVWEALIDCARQLELAARRDVQGVAPGGTIVEPDGRPPGQ